MANVVDLTGQRFGLLVVISRAERNGRNSKWNCACDCGKMSTPLDNNLLRGKTKSCGCAARAAKLIHGSARDGRQSREYQSWSSMIQRCTNPRNHRFKDYGARGIIVCEKWRSSFKEFLGDMGPRPVGKTLDRFPDVNGNYDPGNCRWASRTEQDLNKRNTRRLVFGGKSLTAKEWAGIRGIKEEIIYNRVFGLNWTVRRALTEQPTGGRGRNPASYRPKRYQDVRAIRLREGYKPTK